MNTLKPVMVTCDLDKNNILLLKAHIMGEAVRLDGILSQILFNPKHEIRLSTYGDIRDAFEKYKAGR